MASKNYDSALGMYIERPAVPRLERLAFLRWLAERGRLEHFPSGPSSGALVPVQPSPEYSGKA